MNRLGYCISIPVASCGRKVKVSMDSYLSIRSTRSEQQIGYIVIVLRIAVNKDLFIGIHFLFDQIGSVQ